MTGPGVSMLGKKSGKEILPHQIEFGNCMIIVNAHYQKSSCYDHAKESPEHIMLTWTKSIKKQKHLRLGAKHFTNSLHECLPS